MRYYAKLYHQITQSRGNQHSVYTSLCENQFQSIHHYMESSTVYMRHYAETSLKLYVTVYQEHACTILYGF